MERMLGAERRYVDGNVFRFWRSSCETCPKRRNTATIAQVDKTLKTAAGLTENSSARYYNYAVALSGDLALYLEARNFRKLVTVGQRV